VQTAPSAYLITLCTWTLLHTSLWQVENEFVPQLNRVLTNVRSVNKTDVVTLLDVFGNLSGNVLYPVKHSVSSSLYLQNFPTFSSVYSVEDKRFSTFLNSSTESVLLSDLFRAVVALLLSGLCPMHNTKNATILIKIFIKDVTNCTCREHVPMISSFC
jgi:hypothetical protein